MRKLGLIVMPIMAISFLANCNKGLGDPKPLEECDWNKINEVSKAGKASEWFKVGDTKKVQLKHQDKNKNGKIDNDEVYQTVRIIDFNHDNLADASGKAGITFEFIDLISDKNGYSLATPWFWERGTSSHNAHFINSNLRKAIDGNGEAKQLVWYQINSSTKSTELTSSVFEMLPEGLKNALKEVSKETADGGDYEITTYNTKLFPLSFAEITKQDPKFAKVEGYIYKFYDGDGDCDSNRIKWQIKHQEGAIDKAIEITDADPTVTWEEGHIPKNYAGCNNKDDSSKGGEMWTRTPMSYVSTGANAIKNDGSFGHPAIYSYLYAVSPAFCI